VFGDSIADNRSLLGGIAGTSAAASFDGRQNDVLAYISPTMANITIAAAYVNLTQTNTTDVQPKNNALSIAAWYDAAPFYGSLAYEQHTLKSNAVGAAPTYTPNTKGDSESAIKGGFGFTIDAFNLGVVYEKTTDKLAANAAKLYAHNAYYVAGKYSFGTSAVKVAYGKLGDIASVANTGSNQISVGYDYGLSKTTKLYAIYSRISNKNAASYGFSQSTSANGNSVNGFGGSPAVLSLGLQTNF
jgi:predicted porin